MSANLQITSTYGNYNRHAKLIKNFTVMVEENEDASCRVW